jgi:hypothetical protein
MYLIFQALCIKICSGISSYLEKPVESDAVFSKVPFLSVFAENKIEEKY